MQPRYVPIFNLLKVLGKTAAMAAGSALVQYASTHIDAISGVFPKQYAGIVSILLTSALLYHKTPPKAN